MSDRRSHRSSVLAGLASVATGAAMAGIITLVGQPYGAYATPDRMAADWGSVTVTGTRPAPVTQGSSAGASIAPTTAPPSIAPTTVISGEVAPPAQPSNGAPTAGPVPSATKPGPGPRPTTTPRPTPTTTTRTTAPRPAISDQDAQDVLFQVNWERSWYGCPPLMIDSRLNTAAQRHSWDMYENNFFSHTGSDGSSYYDRAWAVGYPNPTAENIARGQRDADQVMQAWMNSSGNRSNILNCSYRTMGIGMDSRGYYWTQVFGR